MEFRKSIWLIFLVLVGCVSKDVLTVLPATKNQGDSCFSGRQEARLLNHKYFEICYDANLRSPLYVRYNLTKEMLSSSKAKRKNKFIPDPILVSKSLPFVSPKEYVGSGFDRGHMAPSADFQFSQEANDTTFVMSNMSPQSKNLNQRAWKYLEDQVRRWACGEEKLTVITGPIYSDDLPTLKSGLVIPQKFFKIIIDDTSPRKLMVFMYDQTDDSNVDINSKIISIAQLKTLTGNAFVEAANLAETNVGWSECKI